MAEGSSSSSDTGDSRGSGDGDRNLAGSLAQGAQHVDTKQQVSLENTPHTAQQLSWHDRQGGHAHETGISQWQQGANTGNQQEILGQISNYPLNLQGMESVDSVNMPRAHAPQHFAYQDQIFTQPHLARFANQPTAGDTGSLRFDSLSNTSNGNSLESHRMGLLYQGDVQRNRPKLQANRRENSEEELFTRGIVFDMSKVNKFAYGDVKKLRSDGATLSGQAIADVLKVRVSDVKVLEDTALPTGCPSRNIIIIGPNARTSRDFILVESLVHLDQKYPELLCLRITNNGKPVAHIANDIAREMSVKNVVICENNQLLLNDMLVTNENDRCRRFKAVRNTKISLVFLHQPSQNVQSRFVIESDAGINIHQLRQAFLQIHGPHIIVGDSNMLHFSFDNKFVEGTICIGTLSWPKRELKLGIHIASSTAVCAKLRYKEYTAKGVPSFKECAIAIEPSLSTAQLRQEVSKYTGKDHKAIKISINGRRVEEMDCLNELGNDLVNGCTLEAGVKKKKTICVRDSTSNRTESFSLYMLEPVQVLKEMVANSFGLEVLHVSLEYKERQLDNRELLVNYPIKNRTQVKMDVFAHRIKFHVYIAFKKIRTTLIVDNVNKSTIDDLLRFCAFTFQFDRRCARVQFRGRCLSRFSTLAEERIPTNDTLVVVFFDQPAKLKGGLINIYTGREDGQINVRLGAVSGGILLHASKKVKPESSESSAIREERVPEGISVCEEHKKAENGTNLTPKRRPEHKEAYTKPNFLTMSERSALRRKFIRKARIVRRNILATERQPPQIRPELRSLESRHFGYETSADSLNLPLGLESSDSETELKTLRTRQETNPSPPEDDGASIDHDESPGLDIPVGHDMPMDHVPVNHDMPINFGKSREVEQRLECIKNCCANIDKLIHSTPRDSSDSCNEEIQNIDVINPDSVIAEEQSKDRGMPVFGDTSGSASDLLQAAATRNVEFYLDTESSDHETGHQLMRTTGNQNAHLYDRLQSMHIVVPYRMGRRRTMTEGDTDLFVYSGNTNMELHRNTTFPVSRLEDNRNAWLNTAGITVEILTRVGRKIGKQWKKLARKLSVAEEEIDNIEDKKNDLHDKACDALMYWKKSKGVEASRERLIEALREIEMAAVAEFVEEISQNYYQTV